MHRVGTQSLGVKRNHFKDVGESGIWITTKYAMNFKQECGSVIFVLKTEIDIFSTSYSVYCN